MSRTRAALTALLLIPALLLAGCDDDEPEPRFGPPSSGAPTSPPADPERADQAAFVQEYFDTISDAISSGSSAGFLEMSAANCANCKTIAKNLERAYANGGRVDGGLWEAGVPAFEGTASLGDLWNVDVRTSKERWLDEDGDLIKTVRASILHFGVALEPAEEGWRVRELKVSS